MTRQCSSDGCTALIGRLNRSGHCDLCREVEAIYDSERPSCLLPCSTVLEDEAGEDVSPLVAIRIAEGVRHD